MATIKQVLRALDQAGGVRQDYRPPTRVEIEGAEEALGEEFPPSFRRFLMQWDGTTPDFLNLLVIDGTSEDAPGIVETNEQQRSEGMPDFLIAFHTDGVGTYVVFDTRSRNDAGECAIRTWDHELSPEENLDEIGDPDPDHEESFADWLLEQIA